MVLKKQQNGCFSNEDEIQIAKIINEFLAKDGTQSNSVLIGPGTTVSAIMKHLRDSKTNKRSLLLTEEIATAALNESLHKLTVQLSAFFKEHQQEFYKCPENVFEQLINEFLATHRFGGKR